MDTVLWLIIWAACLGYLIYHRLALYIGTGITAALLIITSIFSNLSAISLILLWIVYLIIIIPLNYDKFRLDYITPYLLNYAKQSLPSLSQTEQEALESGHNWWETELFCGSPNWKLFNEFKPATLSPREQNFLDNQVTKLCSLINDWEYTHKNYELSEEVWNYVKSEGFLGIIIPQKYGGLEFSAFAHSEIIAKIANVSISASISIAVPNSLGPAELLLSYGTEGQKNQYLPKLANGTEIPCFALTNPEAGSDAGAIPDTGIVCYKTINGEKTLGINLAFNKRYITLAPIATIIGLAFKLFDPDNLLKLNQKSLGITCALIPRDTEGVEIGLRHFPMNLPFQNGPISGKNVFIPIDYIIGGKEMAGQGWRMLMECLAAGRGISLPANSAGLSKMAALNTSAYTRIRTQFNTALVNFEGIQEALSKIIGYTYIINATRTMTAVGIDQGLKPTLASAITKCHATELARKMGNHALDIHGGKGICLGPKNYLGRPFESAPIAITVEGANILTRCMIIFGQGAIRCHPYILEEIQAATDDNLEQFDKTVVNHIGYLCSNIIKSFWLGITNSKFSYAPTKDETRYFYQLINRFSAVLALTADVSMTMLGGKLKRKEGLSARLGDLLSYLYLASAVLKLYKDQGNHESDLPIVLWSCQIIFYKLQTSLTGFIQNFPNKFIAVLLKIITMPLGKMIKQPSDKLNNAVCNAMVNSAGTRNRMAENTFNTDVPNCSIFQLEQALEATIAVEPIALKLRKAIKDGKISSEILQYQDQIQAAVKAKVLTVTESKNLTNAYNLMLEVIAVDAFTEEELKN